MMKILAISGSIKSKSTNGRLIQLMKDMAPADVVFAVYDELDRLPFFNPDSDTDSPPDAVLHFRRAIGQADAVIICTPEYVFSLPGILKNALEWTVSSSTLSGKPVALIVAAASGIKAQESLHLVMTTIEARLSDDTPLLIQGAKGKINTNEEEIKIQLKKVMDKLMKMADALSPS
jgi:NAD(P)H-dependent FMN reductase